MELLSRKAQRLKERKDKVANEAEEIDPFVDQIGDIQMREILCMKCLRGMSWRSMAACGGRCEV